MAAGGGSMDAIPETLDRRLEWRPPSRTLSRTIETRRLISRLARRAASRCRLATSCALTTCVRGDGNGREGQGRSGIGQERRGEQEETM